jgi:hypothetical protein
VLPATCLHVSYYWLDPPYYCICCNIHVVLHCSGGTSMFCTQQTSGTDSDKTQSNYFSTYLLRPILHLIFCTSMLRYLAFLLFIHKAYHRSFFHLSINCIHLYLFTYIVSFVQPERTFFICK